MAKHIYIDNYKPEIPFGSTAVVYLLLDKSNAPEWLWGIMIFCFSIFWIINIILLFNKQSISAKDIKTLIDANTNKTSFPVKKSFFQERLEKMAEERKKTS